MDPRAGGNRGCAGRGRADPPIRRDVPLVAGRPDGPAIDLVALATALRRGRLSAAEAVADCLRRAEETEPAINAYTALFAEEAMREARRLDRLRMRGPLHGVPIAVKDIIDERGRVTTAGIFGRDRPAGADAPAISALKRSGAIIIGRTNLDPLAIGLTTTSSRFGQTRNPYDPDRIPGGSSGGSAAVVAVRSAAAALGTDSSGSVRIPAALCGLVGLMPTHGAVSVLGIVSLVPSLDCLGPITRSVRDARLLLASLIGRADPARRGRVRGGFRVATVEGEYFAGAGADVERGLDRARAALREAGGRSLGIRLPDIGLAPEAQRVISRAEISASLDPSVQRAAPSSVIASRRREGARIRAVDYLQAQRMRLLISDEVDAALERCDVLLTPATMCGAPRVGAQSALVRGRRRDLREVLTRYTLPFNLTGHPAVVVPTGVDDDGLPTAVQLVARKRDEGTLLSIAEALERMLDLRLAPPI